ncbi:Low-density lipoprotein receptor-related protein 1B [Eumeta japonica]|uniref:Low-density lipoprotein receptor-related protein 1B n=1 Tax=Eumeta variegata TaxID=151549 RepID=A0A4C2AH35_EUMVA|nr:Low-density lipoprotein receptor-related protein 1B [Eumeta japonica]
MKAAPVRCSSPKTWTTARASPSTGWAETVLDRRRVGPDIGSKAGPTCRARRALRSDPSNNDSLIYNPLNSGRPCEWVSGRALGAGGARRISAARMDGAEPRTLLAEDLHWPNGLTLLRATNTLYWCDTYLNKIESGECGRNRAAHRGAAPPARRSASRTLALHEGLVLWSEHDTGPCAGCGTRPTPTLHDTPPLYDLRLVDPDARMGNPIHAIFWSTRSNKQRRLRGICLSRRSYCACASGRELDERALKAAPLSPPAPRSLSWTLPLRSSIMRSEARQENAAFVDQLRSAPEPRSYDGVHARISPTVLPSGAHKPRLHIPM